MRIVNCRNIAQNGHTMRIGIGHRIAHGRAQRPINARSASVGVNTGLTLLRPRRVSNAHGIAQLDGESRITTAQQVVYNGKFALIHLARSRRQSIAQLGKGFADPLLPTVEVVCKRVCVGWLIRVLLSRRRCWLH